VIAARAHRFSRAVSPWVPRARRSATRTGTLAVLQPWAGVSSPSTCALPVPSGATASSTRPGSVALNRTKDAEASGARTESAAGVVLVALLVAAAAAAAAPTLRGSGASGAGAPPEMAGTLRRGATSFAAPVTTRTTLTCRVVVTTSSRSPNEPKTAAPAETATTSRRRWLRSPRTPRVCCVG
jgi:hypothetical protein